MNPNFSTANPIPSHLSSRSILEHSLVIGSSQLSSASYFTMLCNFCLSIFKKPPGMSLDGSVKAATRQHGNRQPSPIALSATPSWPSTMLGVTIWMPSQISSSTWATSLVGLFPTMTPWYCRSTSMGPRLMTQTATG